MRTWVDAGHVVRYAFRAHQGAVIGRGPGHCRKFADIWDRKPILRAIYDDFCDESSRPARGA